MEKNKQLSLLYNKNKERFVSRFDAITELAKRNYLHIEDVLNVYLRFNHRVYNGNNNSKKYNLELEKKVFDLTDRYFGIERIKNLKKIKRLMEYEKE